jgi:hypothetical protein
MLHNFEQLKLADLGWLFIVTKADFIHVFCLCIMFLYLLHNLTLLWTVDLRGIYTTHNKSQFSYVIISYPRQVIFLGYY